MIDDSVILPNPCELLGAKDLAYVDTPSNRRVPASTARHDRLHPREPQAQKWHSERGMVDTALQRWTRACERNLRVPSTPRCERKMFCAPRAQHAACAPRAPPRPVSDATYSCAGPRVLHATCAPRALHAACQRYALPLDRTACPARGQKQTARALHAASFG